MAELYIHEIEDPLAHFPPAPPPSPEAHRAKSGFFDGPLDLRREQFPALDLIWSQCQNSTKSSSPLSTVPERGSPFGSSSLTAEEDEYGFPASPQKRMCNSPSSFPEGYDVDNNEFHSSNTLNSSVLSTLNSVRPHRSPVHSHSPPLLSVSNSNSPPFVQNQSLQQTSPYSIPNKALNGFETSSFQPAHSYNPSLSPHSHLGMLSKSFDLHDVHPFQMTSDTILPEVRPRRAQTLDTTKLEKESSQNRRRKMSLKRTNEERDSDLQFSFEYSYTSTGSSEESDWLVVTRDTTGTLPQGKKACQNHTPALPLSYTSPTHTTSTIEASVPPRQPQPPVSNFFPQTIPSVYAQSPLTEQPPSLMSMESVQMMDTGETSLRLDSLDSMECGGGGEQLPSFTEMDTQYPNTQASHPHTTHSTLFSPPTTLRSHSSEERYALNRHSFVQSSKGGTEQGTNSISRSL